MAITPKMVQELRETTGVGMMECKRALEEAGGDKEEAIKILRKKGIATAAKKSTRTTSDGLIAAHVTADGKTGALVEVNCETDFVAKTDGFQDLVKDLCQQVAEGDAADVEGFLQQPFKKDPSQKVGDHIVAVVTKVGENIQFRRFVRFNGKGNMISTYIHPGSKVGVMLEVTCETPNDDVKNLAKDLCMQVAAAMPRFVSRNDVTQEVLDNEREIYRAQMLAQGKPENMVDKIVEGKLGKYYEEACLLEQLFVRDQNVKVQDHIKAVAGTGFRVERFQRYQLGEGMQAQAAE